MITIKQIQSPAVVTDGVTNVNLYAGQTYTCEVPTPNNDWNFSIDTSIQGGNLEFRFRALPQHSFTVDWGDGSALETYNSNSTVQYSHTYSTGGLYDIVISGRCPIDLYNSGNGSEYRLTKVTSCSTYGYSSVAFRTCYYIGEFDFSGLKLSSSNLDYVFAGFSYNLGTVCNMNPEILDVSGVTRMLSTFKYTLMDSDLGSWDIKNVTDMTGFNEFNTTWSQANYEATWVGWLGWSGGAPTKTLNSTVPFHGGNATVGIGSDGAAARSYAINTLGWIVTDGGEV